MGNAGSESIFKQLGLVEKSGDIKCYVENCRRIKQYRDENFTVKNYRNYDLVSTGLDDEDFFPTLTEYNPGLSSEDYDEVLSLFSENQSDLDTVLRIYMMGGSVSCKQIADIEQNLRKLLGMITYS